MTSITMTTTQFIENVIESQSCMSNRTTTRELRLELAKRKLQQLRSLHGLRPAFFIHKLHVSITSGGEARALGKEGGERKPYITIVMKEPRSSVCTQGPARAWDVHYECQLDSIENHHGDKPLGMSVRESLDWAN